MRSPLKSLSRFPSSTDLVVIAALATAACAGCGDDECGPMGASNSGLTASSAEVTLIYGGLTSLRGNDCPDPDAPEGVISISIEGLQQNVPPGDVTPYHFTVCIPRMDLFTPGSEHTLGTSMSNADVRIFDTAGKTEDGCTFAFDSSRPPTGTVIGNGVCGNGDSEAGFALTFDGAFSLRRTCGSTIDTVAVTLVGEIAVSRR
jgi:hypothetical protein